MENFRHNVELMREYPIITGYCLTQAYDVENEKNGLLNFDRSEKYPAKDVRAINGMVGEEVIRWPARKRVPMRPVYCGRRTGAL